MAEGTLGGVGAVRRRRCSGAAHMQVWMNVDVGGIRCGWRDLFEACAWGTRTVLGGHVVTGRDRDAWLETGFGKARQTPWANEPVRAF